MARSKLAEADMRSFEGALAVYQMNAGSFPTTEQGLKALMVRPASNPSPIRWVQMMTRLNPDPWGVPYRYRFPGSTDPKEPEIISAGPDCIEGTSDDISSQDE